MSDSLVHFQCFVFLADSTFNTILGIVLIDLSQIPLQRRQMKKPE